MSLIASISGVRGIVGTGLTPEVIVRYASAFAEYTGHRMVVIGRDGRITGKPIAHIVSSTLLAAGCDVVALGVCPTPTVQIAVEQLKAAGGISITASHNPMEWNGLKFLAPSGMFLDARQNDQLAAIAARADRRYAAWNALGRHRADESFLQQHIRRVLRIPFLNIRAIRKRKLKVVVDCVNAAGSVIVPALLKEFGCRVIPMNCDASGIFPHTPEPLPENLTTLRRRVRKEKADIGIAVDPDADRLVLIDERGEPIGEEYTIVQAIQFVLQREARKRTRSRQQVVVNLSTTRAVDDVAARFGAVVHRTPVGEINVAARMKETGAVIGGEGSGGVILPSVHLGRDSLAGIALTLQHLTDFGGTLSGLRKELPGYVIVKSRVPTGALAPSEMIRRVADRYAGNGKINLDDGVRIDFERSWVHLRVSNTEPIIRIIAEAPDEAAARRLSKEVMEYIRA